MKRTNKTKRQPPRARAATVKVAPKPAADALQISETRYRRLFETAQDGILILDADTGKIADVNPFLTDMLGYSREEFLGKRLWEIGPVLDIEKSKTAFLELQTKKYIRYENLPLQPRDGKSISVEFVSNVYLVDHKEVIQCNIRDISKRARAEAAQRESEERFRALVENASDLIIVLNQDGTLRYSSPAVESMLGFTVAETTGKNIYDFIHPDDMQNAMQAMAHRLGHPDAPAGIMEIRARHADGSWRILEGRGGNLLTNQGVAGIVLNFRDITERKRAENGLKQALAWHQTIFEGSRDATFIADADSRFTAVNGAACELTGYSQAELLTMRVPDLHEEMDLQAYRLYHDRIMAGEEILSEAKILRKDGSKVDTEFNNRCIVIAGVTYMHTTARDITERKRAEEEVRRLAKFPAENPYPVLRLSQDGTVLYANEASEALLRNWGCAVGNHAPNFWRSLVTEAFTSQSTRTIESMLGEQTYLFVIAPVLDGGYANFYGSDITERKRAEAALRESEQQFQILAQVAPVGIFRTDCHGQTLYVNSRWCEISQLTFDQALGDGWLNAVHPDDRAPLAAAWEKAVSDRTSSQSDYRFLRADGSIAWVVGRSVPEFDSSGEIVGYIGTITDITERKRAQETLRESEERYRTILEKVEDGYFETNLAGDFTFFNDSLCKIIGYPREELMGMNNRQYMDKENARRVLQVFNRVYTTGESYASFEWEIVKKDDERRFTESSVSLIRDAKGERTGFRGIVRDITERKRVEEQLRRQATALESAANAIIITDRDGNIQWINPAFTALTGYTAEESQGRNPRELVRSGLHDKAFYKNLWDTVLAGQVWRGEMINRRKDGTLYSEEQTITPVLDAQGRVTHMVAVKQDITERKQREHELVAIANVSAALRAAATRAEMLPIILDQALDLLKAKGATLVMREPVSGVAVVELGRGDWAGFLNVRLPPGGGLSGLVIDTGQPYLSTDVLSDPRLARPDLMGNLRVAACIPLTVQEQTIGALWVGRQSEFSAGEVRLLTAIADIAANAIQRETLHEQTERRLRHLTALSEIDRVITSSFDLRVSLAMLLHQVTAQLGVDAAAVLLFNSGLQALEYFSGHGFHTKAIEQTRLRLGESHAGRAALERRLVQIKNLKEPGNLLTTPLLVNENFVSYLGVPLIAKGQIKGVLEVFHRAPLEPDAEWLGFLQALGEQAAIAIDNVTLFNNLQRSNFDLTMAYDATIEGWSRALDLRDKETQGHTQRVAELTQRLARAMGFSEAELVQVRRGTLLHDIGKMGVPDSILLKPGTLTDEEWVLMRRHPQYAYEMLAPIAYLHSALEIPYCHHEKWDGTGYPRGLKGEQIPLAARIFAVADVWDALCSHRPYRAAWSKEHARQHIQSEAGTHFDPKVVAPFLKLTEGD